VAAALFAASAGSAASPRNRKKPMVELTSSNRKFAVRFSQPAWAGHTRQHDPWQKVEAWSEFNGWRLVEDLCAEEHFTAAFPFEPEQNRWSPDGRYFVVTTAKLDEDLRPGVMDRFTYRFLDVLDAEWVSFTWKLNVASTDNFRGWKRGAPHTMLIAGDRPGEIEEVRPHNEDVP
jgi:hypothetical protein